MDRSKCTEITENIFWTLLLCVGGILQAAAQPQQLPLPTRRNSFAVIAHRGSHLKYPENSLAAVRDAIKMGADYVELDLRSTSDSVLVILHDAAVNRTTGGTGLLKSMPYAAVEKLLLRKGANYPVSHYRIPRFEEVLEICRHRINIYIDCKDADVGQAARLIHKYDMEKEVLVYINSMEQYTAWRALAPEIPLMLSLPNEIRDAATLEDFLDRTPLSLLDGDYAQYSQAMVAAAAARGIPVWPDIQGNNEALFWEKAVQSGFRGLQTDHPRELIRFLKKKHLR